MCAAEDVCHMPDDVALRTPRGHWLFFRFALHHLSSGAFIPSSMFMSAVLSHVLESVDPLARDGAPVQDRQEREALLLQLLAVHWALSDPTSRGEDDFDEERLLGRARAAGFHMVCAELSKRRRDHAAVIDSYLEASKEQEEAVAPLFHYVTTLMLSDLNDTEREVVVEAIMVRLPQLLQTSSGLCARLIVETLSGYHDRVLRDLSAEPELQFSYLDALIRGGDSSGSTSLPSMNELLATAGLTLSWHLQHLYISLLCRFSPDDVYSHVSRHQDYQIDEILQMCQDHDILDASAYLLERTGDSAGALRLTLKSLDARIATLEQSLAEHWQDLPAQGSQGKAVNALVGVPPDITLRVDEVITMANLLCQRSLADSGESETLWFSLLDYFRDRAAEQKRRRETAEKEHKTGQALRVPQALEMVMYGFVRVTLDHMIGHVSLPALLKKITTDHHGENFREFRATIQGVLDTYGYEQRIIATATSLMSTDTFRAIRMRAEKMASAILPSTTTCMTCHCAIDEGIASRNRISVFDCGHCYHEACETNALICSICNKEEPASNAAAKGRGSPIGVPRGRVTKRRLPEELRSASGVLRLQSAERAFSHLTMDRCRQMMSPFDVPEDQGLSLRPTVQHEVVPRKRFPGSLPPVPDHVSELMGGYDDSSEEDDDED